MRSNEELKKYADEIDSDPELTDMIECLIAGNKKLRAKIEAACDQVDEDLHRYDRSRNE